jgi:hypothetical protein
MAITLETVGRRIYLRGDTYSIRDSIRSVGGHWDPDAKAWWLGAGKLAEAQRIVASANESAAGNAPAQPEAPGDSAIVAGRGTYRGKAYYLAGRVTRGRTWHDDEVCPITSRDGSRVLLYFRDGSRQFWAPTAEVQIAKTYHRPQTIERLQRFAEDRARGMSYADYRAEIDGLEDQDYFGEAARVERMGYHAWRSEQSEQRQNGGAS